MVTILTYGSAQGSPKVKLDLPDLKVGGALQLPRFVVRRTTPEGRTEALVVEGLWTQVKVVTVAIDASKGPPQQLVTVEALSGRDLAWKAVKKPQGGRRLGPTIFPKTSI